MIENDTNKHIKKSACKKINNKSIHISGCKIFIYFAQKKSTFFYFTHLFLQNTLIRLSVLHIYSVKYSFFYNFFIILSLIAPLSHRPNTLS